MPHPLRRPGAKILAVFTVCALLAATTVVVGLTRPEAEIDAPLEAEQTGLAEAAAQPAAEVEPEPEPEPIAPMDLGHIRELLRKARYDEARQVYVAPVAEGREATLTLDRELQSKMERLLRSYAVPGGAVVAMDPTSGRLLAVAEYAHGEDGKGLALEAAYPAASVFKLVTAAALLEAGVPPDEKVCYHGGTRRVDRRHLVDDPRRDHACADLYDAMGRSLNVVFAKLAARHLSAEALSEMAGRFLFNQPLPVLPPPPHVDEALVSPATIPDEELEFGRTAAGFGEVYLSPLHGAMLAAAVGAGGILVEPTLVAGLDGDPEAIPSPRRQRVVSEDTALALAQMMERTVSSGTARTAFRERHRNALGTVTAAGKTGSLFGSKPFRDYSWFVGFAPADEPKVAVAVVVVNGLKWRVKAPYLAREAMRLHLVHEKARERQAAASTAPHPG